MGAREKFKVGVCEYKEETFMSVEFVEGARKLIIPRILLNGLELCDNFNDYNPFKMSYDYHTPYPRQLYIKVPIHTEDDYLMKVVDLEYKQPKELTIPEIEKKLGYKIKIKGE